MYSSSLVDKHCNLSSVIRGIGLLIVLDRLTHCVRSVYTLCLARFSKTKLGLSLVKCQLLSMGLFRFVPEGFALVFQMTAVGSFHLCQTHWASLSWLIGLRVLVNWYSLIVFFHFTPGAAVTCTNRYIRGKRQCACPPLLLSGEDILWQGTSTPLIRVVRCFIYVA